ncbi:hypothetical protein P9112_002740 [Eukaryota sp. TZLM1-RC]
MDSLVLVSCVVFMDCLFLIYSYFPHLPSFPSLRPPPVLIVRVFLLFFHSFFTFYLQLVPLKQLLDSPLTSPLSSYMSIFLHRQLLHNPTFLFS